MSAVSFDAGVRRTGAKHLTGDVLPAASDVEQFQELGVLRRKPGKGKPSHCSLLAFETPFA